MFGRLNAHKELFNIIDLANNLEGRQHQFDMKIPISKNWFGKEELEAIQQPLNDGWVVQGRQVKSFEEAFSTYTQAKYSLACSSGTAALQIAVAALGLQPGDEVVVPAFTWVATANVIELLGANVAFCDIDLHSFNIDCQLLDATATSRTVGIIPVHLFGLCAEMREVQDFARKRGLWIVEDAACGLGAMYHGAHAGTIGHAGCFSFHPRKSITTGEGGMITVKADDLACLCDGLRNHGAVPSTYSAAGNTGHSSLLPAYSIPGFNYRLTDIQAALGVAQMRRLDWLLSERRRCADFYRHSLSTIPWLRLPTEASHQLHGWQSYVTLFAPDEPSLENVRDAHKQRNHLMQHLEQCGISTRQGTHSPAHLDFYASKYGIRPEDFPNAYIADRLSLALPLFPGMTEAELDFVSQSLLNYEPTGLTKL